MSNADAFLEGSFLKYALESRHLHGALFYDRSFVQIAVHMACSVKHAHAQGYTNSSIKIPSI